MTQATTRSRSAIAAHPLISAAIALLVAADIFFSLYTPIYARLTPKLGDFPFFYWYQLIWVPVVAVLSWICALLLRTRKTSQPNSHNAPGEPR